MILEKTTDIYAQRKEDSDDIPKITGLLKGATALRSRTTTTTITIAMINMIMKLTPLRYESYEQHF